MGAYEQVSAGRQWYLDVKGALPPSGRWPFTPQSISGKMKLQKMGGYGSVMTSVMRQSLRRLWCAGPERGRIVAMIACCSGLTNLPTDLWA